MAYEWIKVECTTPDKPEVLDIADTTKLDPDAAFGKLMRFWIWADQQFPDGKASGLTQSKIDYLVRHKGFAAAMIKAGWLQTDGENVTIPNFERHNGTTAKKRAEHNRLVARLRETGQGYDKNVTKKTSQKYHKHVTSGNEIESQKNGLCDINLVTKELQNTSPEEEIEEEYKTPTNKHTETLISTSAEKPPEFCVSEPAKVCMALKDAGIGKVNPGNLDLIALLQAGATIGEFVDAATDAIPQGKGTFAYILGTVKNRRRQAQETSKLTTAPQPKNGGKNDRSATYANLTGRARLPAEKSIDSIAVRVD